MSEENRTKIIDAYSNREAIEHFARLVPNSEIAENEYNISVSSYVEQEDLREIIDIAELNAEIETIVKKQSELRIQIDAIVADLEGN